MLAPHLSQSTEMYLKAMVEMDDREAVSIGRLAERLSVTPVSANEMVRRLVADLASNRASIASPEGLRALLGLYNLQILSDQQSGRANVLRVESVRGVASALSHRIIKCAPARGTRFAIDVDEAGFAGPGDAFLFGCALDDLLASQASLSSFVELTLRLTPSLREYAWPPRNGQKVLL